MADANTERLDAWFERLERLPVPEGFRVEIVGGNVHITPQRDTHWETIRRIVRALEDRFGRSVKVFSDVRIDFPGHENGFCPDITVLKDSATKESEGRWRCHIYTEPKGSEYEIETRVPFGKDLDLTGTVVDLILKTDEFPRD